MYVCMYVCMYVYVYACMHVCMYVCMYMHVCMYVCMYACMQLKLCCKRPLLIKPMVYFITTVARLCRISAATGFSSILRTASYPTGGISEAERFACLS